MRPPPSTSDAPPRRSYNDACGAAHALDLIGERWALLVVRELMLGPKRFGDLRSGLPGISANVLTQRLEGLEAAGVVLRRRLPPPASVHVYELTPWGYEAEPILQTLGRWAARSPTHDPTLPLSAVSLMLSFRTMFDAGSAKGVALRLVFAIGAESFAVRIGDGELAIRRGDDPKAEARIAGPPEAIAGAVYGKVPLDRLEADGRLAVTGARDTFVRFVTLFHLPEKAAVDAAASD